MSIFFTSDCHFYHKNILKFCDRPFPDVPSMNEGLIKRWNSVVCPKDTVIVVGDFCFGNSTQREEILNKLNGTKILVQGNHDKAKQTPKGFQLMVRKLTVEIAGMPVTVSHYPLKWPKWRKCFMFLKKLGNLPSPRYLHRYDVDRGQYHIHGHTHSTERFNENQIHVGMDAWNCYPVPIKTIVSYIARREKALGGRHE